MSVTDPGPKWQNVISAKLWTCQRYMENMSTVLKPEEILFRVLFFFRRKPRQLRTFVKLLPLSNINNLNSVNNINSF